MAAVAVSTPTIPTIPARAQELLLVALAEGQHERRQVLRDRIRYRYKASRPRPLEEACRARLRAQSAPRCGEHLHARQAISMQSTCLRVQPLVERCERIDSERALVAPRLIDEFDVDVGEEHVRRLQLGRRLMQQVGRE